MAVDGVLPTALGKLHPKHKTPYVAIAFMGVITLLLIATGSIVYIASLSLFADLLYYVIGFGAFIGLRKRFPKMERPFVAPGGAAGAVASIAVYLVMMSQLPSDAFTTGFIWCVLGAVIYLVRKEKPGLDVEIVEEPAPTIEERQTLDNEFKRWRLIVLTLFCLALLLCFVPFIFG
jgi:APA family basic amino acid/polyamine antiporter